MSVQITKKGSKPNYMWNCKWGSGGSKRKMHDKSTWSVPDSFCLHRNGFMGFSAEKGTKKKLRSWVQKIKLHFHWSQTCKSCPINHSCLKIPINGLKCWAAHMVHLCNIWASPWKQCEISQCQSQTLCTHPYIPARKISITPSLRSNICSRAKVAAEDETIIKN